MTSRQRGISLLDIVTGLFVVGLSLSFAVPASIDLVADFRRAMTVNELVATLNNARHKSVMARRPVVVCGSADGVRCDGDWSGGWIGFVEPAGWRPRDPVPDDDVITRRAAVHGSVSITANRDRFRFRPFTHRSTNGTIVVCTDRGGGRAAVISYTGRVRTTPDLPDWARRCHAAGSAPGA